jgi:oligopeptide/dipeptide ABC transporter ATP-binding protein
VQFGGVDVLALSAARMRRLRRDVQMIFQDPLASLHPRMTVETAIGEPLAVHGIARGAAERRRRVQALLERVGLSADHVRRYPHELSGGQRQRVVIARALALGPKLIVCDEPVSALDVSIQAHILNLLMDLQHDLGLSYLLIAHNLAVVRHCSDDVAVMYLGRIVEQASAVELYANPRHPYTQTLLAAVPEPDPTRRGLRVVLCGEPPSPLHPPEGCAFHPRCPFAEPRCRRETPRLLAVDAARAEARGSSGVAGGHVVACHLAAELPAGAAPRGLKPAAPVTQGGAGAAR